MTCFFGRFVCVGIQVFKIHCYFRQRWKDDRLFFQGFSGNVSRIIVSDLKRIWMPDLIVLNEVKSQLHDLLLPNHSAYVSDDGSVLVAARLTLQIRCNVNFLYFPHDQQKCKIQLESFGFYSDEIRLEWDDKPYKSGLQLNLMDSTNIYSVTDMRTVVKNLQSGNDNKAKYSVLELELLFSRNFQPYIWSVYLPYTVLVLICCGATFLKEMFTSQIVVVVAALFLMLTLPPDMEIIRNKMTVFPAIVAWIFGCFGFVMALLLNIVVSQRQFLNQKNRHMMQTKPSDQEGASAHTEQLMSTGFYKCGTLKITRMDIFNMVYIVLFVLFNAVYWIVCYSARYSSLEEWTKN